MNPGDFVRLMLRLTPSLGILIASSSLALAQAQSTVVSFGVEAGEPTVETVGAVAVEPRDAVNLDDLVLLWLQLPDGEDLDAIHFLPNSNLLFSTTTSVILDGVIYSAGDIIQFDGLGYSLFFDDANIIAAATNVDAFTMLPNGNLLLSTSLSAEIFGFSFLNGDVVEVDPVAETASLFMGLDEATLFTGANQDIDALHYDDATGNLLISVRTAGIGTIGGLAYGLAEGDLFELDLTAGVSASVYLDGTGLFDGSTRQVDAAFVPEPAFALSLLVGSLGVARLGRSRPS